MKDPTSIGHMNLAATATQLTMIFSISLAFNDNATNMMSSSEDAAISNELENRCLAFLSAVLSASKKRQPIKKDINRPSIWCALFVICNQKDTAVQGLLTGNTSILYATCNEIIGIFKNGFRGMLDYDIVCLL